MVYTMLGRLITFGVHLCRLLGIFAVYTRKKRERENETIFDMMLGQNCGIV